ncbi:MAG: helix-turn-helix domain-containing protein [Bifidobacteriaceae bacterium]|jgi:AraC family transcriptional regulator of adaptative response / DNA-3-methyladenine glycosylase II|nr:helix-turn-helix domain-containing protein [Bifidobacteriaceae bacterium]
MLADHDACYRALASHDARFDGRVFVGVTSTGVYCRPVCRVRLPLARNCVFYPSAAAAEVAGFRPCLKCRPELAPGLAPVDAQGRLARRAALIMTGEDVPGGVEEVAARLSVTARHLRRAFGREYGVAPAGFLRTRRLLLAKALLTDTALPIADVAFTSGFGSIRRFNETFREHYRMAPGRLRSGLRRPAAPDAAPRSEVTVLTGYRPPLDWEGLLGFLGARTIAGIDAADDGTYQRAVRLVRDGHAHDGHITVRPSAGRDALAVTVSASLLPVLPTVLARVRALFDLDCEPLAIHDHLRPMDDLIPGANRLGVRVPGAFDPFEMAVRAVIGQQVSVKAARTVTNRFTEALGEPVGHPARGLIRVFPSAEAIAAIPGPIEETLGPLGVTRRRAGAIRALAEAMASGTIDLSPTADVAATMERLLAVSDIGPWTAHYLAMRALAWPDAFPHTDFGVKLALTRALGPDADISAGRILDMAEDWKPWRAYAAMNLWRTL